MIHSRTEIGDRDIRSQAKYFTLRPTTLRSYPSAMQCKSRCCIVDRWASISTSDTARMQGMPLEHSEAASITNWCLIRAVGTRLYWNGILNTALSKSGVEMYLRFTETSVDATVRVRR